MHDGTETAGQLVVATRDTTEILEAIEETFDQVARLVAMPIDGALIDSVASQRHIGDQCRSLSHIRHLSAGQDQTQGITQGINAGMDLSLIHI